MTLSSRMSREKLTDEYHRLKPVTTQHALTTQHLVVDDTYSAKATTYFTGVHLGRGKWEGQLVTAYGKYVDELICVPAAKTQNAEIEAGASGLWKISKRTVTFFGRVGEEGVMEGEG
jgi:putative IMPACT (imprinted ancient) family translation regulator